MTIEIKKSAEETVVEVVGRLDTTTAPALDKTVNEDITYEINRWAGRHDNGFTKILTAPGMWMQNFTTYEPDDSMIEVAIRAVEAVLPEKEGEDRW